MDIKIKGHIHNNIFEKENCIDVLINVEFLDKERKQYTHDEHDNNSFASVFFDNNRNEVMVYYAEHGSDSIDIFTTEEKEKLIEYARTLLNTDNNCHWTMPV